MVRESQFKSEDPGLDRKFKVFGSLQVITYASAGDVDVAEWLDLESRSSNPRTLAWQKVQGLWFASSHHARRYHILSLKANRPLGR